MLVHACKSRQIHVVCAIKRCFSLSRGWTTVNGPVPNHFYFKAYSKLLLRVNKISVLLFQSTIIPLNNEPQFVSFGLCYVSYHGFEVGSQFAQLRVICPVSNHFRNSKKLPSVVQLH